MKNYYNPDENQWAQIILRPTQTFEKIEPVVKAVFQQVKINGDEAVRRYTQEFDKVTIDYIKVSEQEINRAIDEVDEALKTAIEVAKANIEKFHEAQRTDKVVVETMPGINCWQEKRPIEKVGLYIPGGTAPLFSTVLMLAIPAKLASCQEIVLCSPPNSQGQLHPAILFAAQLCGVTNICKVGGVQAIAAMTFGTQMIPKVNKIFGPGNQYVTVAKQWATKFGLAIDMPAGPSELLVVADDSAVPDFVASDLLSQAEHGADSQVLLVSTSEALIRDVNKSLKQQLPKLPRKEIAEKAMANSRSVYFTNHERALQFINAYAPEHLIICTKNEDFYVNQLTNAGSVFIGNYTPESAGDYASGTNHTLPTNGYAKQYSGVNLDSFMKAITFQKISPEGMVAIGENIEVMADNEGLYAHKNAVTLRLERIANANK